MIKLTDECNITKIKAFWFDSLMSGGHSGLVPRLPIPNRTVKRPSADDSMDTHVKVGHRQTPHKKNPVEWSAGSFALIEAVEQLKQ